MGLSELKPAASTRQAPSIHDPYDAYRSIDCPTGLVTHEPKKVYPGTVVFFTFAGNKIVTVDPAGNITNEVSRPRSDSLNLVFYRPCKPAADGFLCTLSHLDNPKEKRSIGLVDKKGQVVWATKPLPLSHDFDMVKDRIYTILRKDEISDGETKVSNNVIVLMDKEGSIKWSWSVLGHLAEFRNYNQVQAAIEKKETNNPFHVNTVQYVNNEFVIKEFGEPIIVLSSRNMNLVFFVGQNTGRILFELDNTTKGQHYAHIIESGLPGENNLLVFDNQNNHEKRTPLGGSRVIEIDIKTKKIVWSYESKPGQPVFFTPIVGSAQRLLNGNTLVCQGYYGRIFEVDRLGNIVWDYTSPFVDANNYSAEKGPREIFTATKY
ncbi:aryl-sulfate sulfotransferase [Candidatus Roizmanbacteria bacterium]|nr:aryl-sulfate sulfotransferase [Candidatus Roizmanbacteria bacterium]